MRYRLTNRDLARILGTPGEGTRARTSRPREPSPREAEVQRAVIAFLEAKGCVVVRVNGGLLPRADGGRMRCSTATVGTCCDLLCIAPGGRALAVEVKRPGGKPTPGQERFLSAAGQLGAVAVVVSSIDQAAAALAKAMAREGGHV